MLSVGTLSGPRAYEKSEDDPYSGFASREIRNRLSITSCGQANSSSKDHFIVAFSPARTTALRTPVLKSETSAQGCESTFTKVRFAASPSLPTNPSIALPKLATRHGIERVHSRLNVSPKGCVPAFPVTEHKLRGATAAAKSCTSFVVRDPPAPRSVSFRRFPSG